MQSSPADAQNDGASSPHDNSPPDNWICPKCDIVCDTDSEALHCDFCNMWYHAKCEGYTSETYNAYSKVCDQIKTIKYYCIYNNCETKAEDHNEAIKCLAPLKKMVDSNTARIENLEAKVDKLDTGIEQIV